MTIALQDKAKACMDQNDWAGALPLWQQALEQEPHNTYMMGSLAFCHSRMKQHGQAIELYEKLCELEPDNARWPYTLGYQYYDQQDYRTAVECFDKALTLNPDYIVVLYRKGYAQSQMGPEMRGRALTTFERCRTAYHKLPGEEAQQREKKHYLDACYQQGKLFADAGNTQNAIVRLKEVLESRPTDADVLYTLGKACVTAGHYGEAVDYLEAARRVAPQPEHYILDRLAQAYVGLGRLQDAIQLYTQMPPRMRSQWAYISRHLGELYVQTEQWDLAEKVLQDAVSRDRRNHNGFYYLGLALQGQERWGEAARAFENAIKLRRQAYEKDFPDAEAALQVIRRDHGDSLRVESPHRRPSSKGTSGDGRMVGKVKNYNTDKGFGFLQTDDGDLFFHISQVVDRGEVQVGERFEFQLGEGRDGRPAAVNLRVVSRDGHTS